MELHLNRFLICICVSVIQLCSHTLWNVFRLFVADLVKVHLRQISVVLNTSQVRPCMISMAIHPSRITFLCLVLRCLSANLEPDTRWQVCIFLCALSCSFAGRSPL